MEDMVRITEAVTIPRSFYDTLMADHYAMDRIRLILRKQMQKDGGRKTWTSVSVYPEDVPGFEMTEMEDAGL